MSEEEVKEKKTAELIKEVDEWIKENIGPARMYYYGNEDEGKLSYLSDSDENGTVLPKEINEKILMVSSLACNLFIDAKFRRDVKRVERVKSEHGINFHVMIGESDSFGPMTYVLASDHFVIVIF